MATLHIMVGLPCSGKTTYAHRLADEVNALVLTPDIWHLKLFGDDAERESHDKYHGIIEVLLLDVAERALVLGCNGMLDYGF